MCLCACYKFNPDSPCTISCTDECPTGLACSNGMCAPPGMSCSMPGDGGGGSDTGRRLGSACYGSAGFVHVCFEAPPTGMVMLPQQLDTDN